MERIMVKQSKLRKVAKKADKKAAKRATKRAKKRKTKISRSVVPTGSSFASQGQEPQTIVNTETMDHATTMDEISPSPFGKHSSASRHLAWPPSSCSRSNRWRSGRRSLAQN